LYAYDLTTDLAEDDHFNLVKHGNVRLALKFSAALELTVTVIAYAEIGSQVVSVQCSRNKVEIKQINLKFEIQLVMGKF